MSQGVWGKGYAYPLIGDKVFVRNDHRIWEVHWLTSSKWGIAYRLIPWPTGGDEYISLSLETPFSQLRPLDVLTRIYVALVESEQT